MRRIPEITRRNYPQVSDDERPRVFSIALVAYGSALLNRWSVRPKTRYNLFAVRAR